MKLIAKPGTWFDAGTEVEMIDDYGGWGLFRGWRTCENPDAESRQLGERYLDEEACPFSEFEVAA